MIYRIEIENFLSIRETQILDLRALANAPLDTDRLASCWRGSNERAPKVVAVFGANGSGKSNLLRALSFAAWFLHSSFTWERNRPIPCNPFNNHDSLGRPTRFKFYLGGPADLGAVDQPDVPECPYCYELVIDNGSTSKVLSEQIFYWPAPAGRKTRLVERFEDGTVKASKGFGLTGLKRVLEEALRPNASVVSTLAQFNHPVATAIADSAGSIRSNLVFGEKVDFNEDLVSRRYINHAGLVEQINREINRIDLGVSALEVTSTNNGQQLLFRHQGLAWPMPLMYESHGTRQILKLFPMIADVLSTGSIAIVDELDAAIHSMLLPEIINWFYDPVRNPHNAQLWTSCHNASLLEELTKEEVVFCEKDWHGRTTIYALNDIKGVRRDENYYKKYLGGVFGAVPQFG